MQNASTIVFLFIFWFIVSIISMIISVQLSHFCSEHYFEMHQPSLKHFLWKTIKSTVFISRVHTIQMILNKTIYFLICKTFYSSTKLLNAFFKPSGIYITLIGHPCEHHTSTNSQFEIISKKLQHNLFANTTWIDILYLNEIHTYLSVLIHFRATVCIYLNMNLLLPWRD